MAYLITIAPYHIYTLTLTEGVNTRFLKMRPTSAQYYDGKILNKEQPDTILSESKTIYNPLHFKNFELILPTNFPSINFIPNIKVESEVPKIGAMFIDSKNKFHFSFMIEHEFKFKTNLINQDLYFLPFFRSYIETHSEEEKWKDIFSKTLSLPSNEGKSFFETLKVVNQYKYQELVYNLYILNNRVSVLPEKFNQIYFDPESSLGIIELENINSILVERVLFLKDGFIYPITIKTNLNSKFGRFSRLKIINNLKFKASTKDSAIPIYVDYQNLEYADRIEQKGMIYLYSAWSHDLDNKEYIRLIIQFLERGNSNIKYLKTFYEYAFKKFGSNLSQLFENLKESNLEKLKRMSSDELEKEIIKENQTVSSPSDVDSMTNDEKIKYNLIKAKEKNQNTDELKKEISIE